MRRVRINKREEMEAQRRKERSELVAARESVWVLRGEKSDGRRRSVQEESGLGPVGPGVVQENVLHRSCA